eukprot:TRINITY_DN24764_c0_g1_i3.p1 TRINITY_DN24764_c0_g1~~TRINITY_DN24764_c0_g1_i3.p1  ORF type:complete len:387 (-),score=58.93 TRINITY_DN24764_c0_g1_i3:689-1849(-)
MYQPSKGKLELKVVSALCSLCLTWCICSSTVSEVSAVSDGTSNVFIQTDFFIPPLQPLLLPEKQDRYCHTWGPCDREAVSESCSFDAFLQHRVTWTNASVEERSALQKQTPDCLSKAAQCVVQSPGSFVDGCLPGLLLALMVGIWEAGTACSYGQVHITICIFELEHLYSSLVRFWPRSLFLPSWDQKWSLMEWRQRVDWAYDNREQALLLIQTSCVGLLRHAASTNTATPWAGEAFLKRHVEETWARKWVSGAATCQINDDETGWKPVDEKDMPSPEDARPKLPWGVAPHEREAGDCLAKVPEWAICGMATSSQLGQDLWVLRHFGHVKDGIFVEVGANHPKAMSNSYLLEQVQRASTKTGLLTGGASVLNHSLAVIGRLVQQSW